MDQYKICPKCNQKYTQHSAISRVDNKTNICPTCGIKEALIQFIKQKKCPKEFDFPGGSFFIFCTTATWTYYNSSLEVILQNN